MKKHLILKDDLTKIRKSIAEVLETAPTLIRVRSDLRQDFQIEPDEEIRIFQDIGKAFGMRFPIKNPYTAPGNKDFSVKHVMRLAIFCIKKMRLGK